MPSYYDAVLALIPALLVGVSAGLATSGIAYTTAVLLGAGSALTLVGHALFVRAPTDPGAQEESTSNAALSRSTSNEVDGHAPSSKAD